MVKVKQVKETVATGLQLKRKWVRVMLISSLIAIIGIILIPVEMKREEAGQIQMMQVDSLRKYSAPILDTTIALKDTKDSARLIIRKMNPQSKSAIHRPIPVTIVETEKPFDWKSTVTWIIGAINGLILVVLNVKNLLTKKTA